MNTNFKINQPNNILSGVEAKAIRAELTFFMSCIFMILTISVGCNKPSRTNDVSNNDIKQKELELKEKELELKERELALKEKDTITVNKEIAIAKNELINENRKVEKKCESKYQLVGKLIEAEYGMCGLRIHILTDKGDEWVNLDNYDVKIDNQRLFKWSNNEIKKFVANGANFKSIFPSDAIDFSYLNKKYIFCCRMGMPQCGDDPDAKTEYCFQIFTP